MMLGYSADADANHGSVTERRAALERSIAANGGPQMIVDLERDGAKADGWDEGDGGRCPQVNLPHSRAGWYPRVSRWIMKLPNAYPPGRRRRRALRLTHRISAPRRLHCRWRARRPQRPRNGPPPRQRPGGSRRHA